MSQNFFWAFLLSAHASASPSSVRQRGDVADPRRKSIAVRIQNDCFWSQLTDFRGCVGCILVSLFYCYSLVNKGSMVSFPREQKCEVCLLWGFCRVRVWLIAKRLLSGQKRECKMTEVCVGLGADGEERSFASLYSSFFLLIDQTL